MKLKIDSFAVEFLFSGQYLCENYCKGIETLTMKTKFNLKARNLKKCSQNTFFFNFSNHYFLF